MPKQFLYIFGGAIGDALLGVHLGRTLSTAVPGTKLTLISTRENAFVRELLHPLPFINFVEMPKGLLHSWCMLMHFSRSLHYTVLYEPFTSPVSIWWRIIIKVATFRKGSIDVRCVSHERTALGLERVVSYDCRTDQMFDLIPRILCEWGISAPVVKPHLEVDLYQSPIELPEKPYIVLHFFAPSILRSVPILKAQEIILAMRKTFPHHRLVLTCANNEIERARHTIGNPDVEIRHGLSSTALVFLLAGAHAYVGVDTGVTHLASHVGIPCVVLGNRSNPCWLPYYAPRVAVLFESKRCGCNGNKTGECVEQTLEGPVYRCLFDIKTETILEKLGGFIVD